MDDTEGFAYLGHSNLPFCSPSSQFGSGNFQLYTGRPILIIPQGIPLSRDLTSDIRLWSQPTAKPERNVDTVFRATT